MSTREEKQEGFHEGNEEFGPLSLGKVHLISSRLGGDIPEEDAMSVLAVLYKLPLRALQAFPRERDGFLETCRRTAEDWPVSVGQAAVEAFDRDFTSQHASEVTTDEGKQAAEEEPGPDSSQEPSRPD